MSPAELLADAIRRKVPMEEALAITSDIVGRKITAEELTEAYRAARTRLRATQRVHEAQQHLAMLAMALRDMQSAAWASLTPAEQVEHGIAILRSIGDLPPEPEEAGDADNE